MPAKIARNPLLLGLVVVGSAAGALVLMGIQPEPTRQSVATHQSATAPTLPTLTSATTVEDAANPLPVDTTGSESVEHSSTHDGIGVVSVQVADPEATVAYWTPERMRAAQPAGPMIATESGAIPKIDSDLAVGAPAGISPGSVGGSVPSRTINAG
jgi:hypothetical protein